MGSTGDALVFEVGYRPQPGSEQVGVGHGPRAFTLAHVEPDAGTRSQMLGGFPDQRQDRPVVPPDGRRKDREFAEDVRILQAKVKRGQPAERRAAQPGVRRASLDLVLSGDERQQFLYQKPPVFAGFASAHLPINGWSVLRHPALL